MEKKETKYSLEKEIREALASGRSQKSIYDTLKEGKDDSVLADKVGEYLPLNVRNKTKYYNCAIIFLLVANAALSMNFLVIILAFFLYFYLKEGNGFGYRILFLFSLLNMMYAFYTDKTEVVQVKMILWALLGITGILFYKFVFTNKTIMGKTKKDQNDNYIFLD
ncbi:hypothetical protein [Sebaldella sp. S0638]|uniref:hypothetical protein n=1 Tax=Sebaldella sp. S0638 TaxID=2957809 RepID=UPI00209F8AE5|nr:hypothetical protein [Sebaldella sp. S0638]MCP1223362.1 hypothetical protein [Sebaldella sp. S0638]